MNSANAVPVPPASLFSNILTAAEYSVSFCLYAFSLQYVLRILFQLFSRSKHLLISQDKHGLSKLLITNLICWAILMGSALPHIGWMLIHWRPEGRSMNPYTIFWTTIVTECLMAMIPYSLFFLSLDRIFAIQLLNAYQDRQSRLVLIPCIFTLLIVFAINLYAFCQIMPLPPTTECNVFACLMTNGNTTFIVFKLFGGVTIIFAGGYLLKKLRKRQAMIKTNMQINPSPKFPNKIEPDSLVILMICTELGLNFLPQLMIFILQTLLGHQIATEIGPINHFLNSIDALISTLTYVHTLRRFLHSKSQNRINNGIGGGVGIGHGNKAVVGEASQSVPKY